MLRAYWIVAQHPAQAHKLLHELKAEMEDDRLAPARKTLLIVIRPPLAPRALLETGKRGVVQAPLNHELLKVPGRSLPCVSTLCESVALACSVACRAIMVYW